MTDEIILKSFESIGIPKMQTIVYLDLIKNKESTATQVSKRTKIHRSNVYDTLTKLKERNLVYLSNKEGKQLFTALPTDLIINEEKEKLNSAEIKSVTFGGIDDNVSMTEWAINIENKEREKKTIYRVNVQHWKDDKIINEKLYFCGDQKF